MCFNSRTIEYNSWISAFHTWLVTPIYIYFFFCCFCCFLKFLADIYVLLWDLWYTCFRLLVMSSLGFKARLDFLLAHFLVYMLFPRFTSGTTPTNFLMAGMAAGHIHYMHLAKVGCQVFIQETLRTVTRYTIHSVTATGLGFFGVFEFRLNFLGVKFCYSLLHEIVKW